MTEQRRELGKDAHPADLSTHRTRSNVPTENRWPLAPVGSAYDYARYREQNLDHIAEALANAGPQFEPEPETDPDQPDIPVDYPYDFSAPGLGGITPKRASLT